MFLVQYTSKEFDRSDQTVATGDCCYRNPMVRRTFRFLGEFGQLCSCGDTLRACVRCARSLNKLEIGGGGLGHIRVAGGVKIEQSRIF